MAAPGIGRLVDGTEYSAETTVVGHSRMIGLCRYLKRCSTDRHLFKKGLASAEQKLCSLTSFISHVLLSFFLHVISEPSISDHVFLAAILSSWATLQNSSALLCSSGSIHARKPLPRIRRSQNATPRSTTFKVVSMMSICGRICFRRNSCSIISEP